MNKKQICNLTEDIASRDCVGKNGEGCPCCDNIIRKGEYHIKVATPKRKSGYHLHTKCVWDFARVWSSADAEKFTEESHSNSSTCRNHKVVVYGSVNDTMYFIGENGMCGKKMNKTVARYQTEWKTNRQSIGAVLSTCFKHNLRCFVKFDDKSMIEVFSKVEYTKLTDVNK